MRPVRISRQLFDPLPGHRDGRGSCASRSKLQAFGSAASLYIHKILSDARSEGPRVQEPSQLELILNLRTANPSALDPSSADEMIR